LGRCGTLLVRNINDYRWFENLLESYWLYGDKKTMLTPAQKAKILEKHRVHIRTPAHQKANRPILSEIEALAKHLKKHAKDNSSRVGSQNGRQAQAPAGLPQARRHQAL